MAQEPELFHCTPEELEYYLPKAILDELRDPTSPLREQAFTHSFGMDISKHPYFDAEIEHPPLTEEEQEFLRQECGGFLPKSVADLTIMRNLLSSRRDPEETFTNKRGKRVHFTPDEAGSS